MGDKSISQTLQTLVELIERSRQLRKDNSAVSEEVRRVDILIDWTLQSLREGITSEMVMGIFRDRSVAR